MKRLFCILTFLLLTAVPTATTFACPMCKESIPNSDAQEAANLPGGFNMSVYYMLGGFFMTLGLVSGLVVKGVRNANVQVTRFRNTNDE